MAKKPAKPKPEKKPPAKPKRKGGPGRPKIRDDAEAYERHKAAMVEASRKRSATAREIGPLPEVDDPDRREECRLDLRRFCEVYFPERFHIGWSPDHIEVIASIQKAIIEGGLYALAMPRGSGKTSICEAASLWSLLFGHRKFVVFVGASERHAEGLLDSCRVEIENNPLLGADFPEVCYPVRRLEGIAMRAAGQTLDGERTRIAWTAKELVLPTVAESAASGSVLRTIGITGSVRGIRHMTAEGRPIRPDFVVIDDPQDDESAKSGSQTQYRETVITGAILGLAGPKQRISAVMPCTVIQPGDLADRFLDRKRYPEWQGRATKTLYGMPERMDLWEEYQQIRLDGLRSGSGTAEATAWYAERQAEMDRGARPAWPERFLPGQISGVQYAMDLYLSAPRVFAAEYQNEPIVTATAGEGQEMREDTVCDSRTGLERGVVPQECDRLTAFIDVQGQILYWMVCGWDRRFGGSVIDYGTTPKQQVAWFSTAAPQHSLTAKYPGLGPEAVIHRGLDETLRVLLAVQFRKEDGSEIPIDRIFVDAGWGPMTDTVYSVCRSQSAGDRLLPWHGRYVGASSRPMSEWPKRPGERIGSGWRVVSGGSGRRHIIADVNHWKSFVAARLLTDAGSPGSLRFFGSRRHDHSLLASHLTAEYRITTSGRGRAVEEWKQKPDRVENHWWDCLVGCAVAASVSGLESSSAVPGITSPEPKKRLNLREIQQQNAKEGRFRNG